MVVDICLLSMHSTTVEILKEIRIIGLLPARSNVNSYISYEVTNSYDLTRINS